MGKVEDATDGDVGLLVLPYKVDRVGEPVDFCEAMKLAAATEKLRQPGDQVQAGFDAAEKFVPEPGAARFIPLERFLQIGLGAGRDGKRVGHDVRVGRLRGV